jgi:hypothetical protein
MIMAGWKLSPEDRHEELLNEFGIAYPSARFSSEGSLRQKLPVSARLVGYADHQKTRSVSLFHSLGRVVDGWRQGSLRTSKASGCNLNHRSGLVGS